MRFGAAVSAPDPEAKNNDNIIKVILEVFIKILYLF